MYMSDKEDFIKLTLALYRVTELFPKNEPLKLKLRSLSLDILSSLNLLEGNPVSLLPKEKDEIIKKGLQDLELLKGYLQVAKEQGWVDNRNFLVLEREYSRLQPYLQYLENESLNTREKQQSKNKENKREERLEPIDDEISGFQKKILEILEQKGKLKAGEVSQFLPELTSRTVRRHLKILKAKKLIEISGNGPQTFYKT